MGEKELFFSFQMVDHTPVHGPGHLLDSAERKLRYGAHHPPFGDAVSLYSLDLTGRVALVFGNEHEGVSEELRARADGNFIIPQVGIIQSLNISVACAVSIYEAYRQKSAAGHYDQPKLQGAYLEELRTDWGFQTMEEEEI